MTLQISGSQINNEKGCKIYFSKKMVAIYLKLNISFFWLQKKKHFMCFSSQLIEDHTHLF